MRGEIEKTIFKNLTMALVSDNIFPKICWRIMKSGPSKSVLHEFEIYVREIYVRGL